MTCVLILGGLLLLSAAQQPLEQPPEANSIFSEEPITPVPKPPQIDPLKVRLGERLFGDPRLSRDNLAQLLVVSRSWHQRRNQAELRRRPRRLKRSAQHADRVQRRAQLPLMRLPSLRNVAMTPPYFHDGSAETLDDAVRKMGMAQLNSTLTDEQVKAIVAYLGTLTGKYRGAQVGAAP